MNLFKPQSIPLAILALTAWGCVDDNYDLSDIDTNVQLAVNELTVPIKIDEGAHCQYCSDSQGKCE